jgi:predicted ribosomally synthesized peptide with SipW-like signal peptide
MKLKTVAMTGVLSLAGLGLVGAGAHAAWTTSTSSSQTITAGTVGPVLLVSPDSPLCATLALAETNDCTTLTLPTVGPEGSTFDTTPLIPVTIYNEGNVPVSESAIQLTDSSGGTSADNALASEMDICISSDPGSSVGAGYSYAGGLIDGATIVANGPLSTGLALTPSVTLIGPVLAASGGTDEYQVDFYAGENSAECGSVWSDGGHTASAWSLAGYPSVNPWVTPASLTNAAEGGAVTVTLTFTYTG